MANEGTSKILKLTLEDILAAGSLNISNIAWQQIDPNLWFTPVSHDSTETHFTTWVARYMQDYTYGNLVGDDLFFAFQEDFENWTEANFNKIAQPFKRELKLLLRNRGIYTGKNNSPIARQLSNLLNLESCPKWPSDELPITSQGESNKNEEKVKQVNIKDSLLESSVLDSIPYQRTTSKLHSPKLPREKQQSLQSHNTDLSLSLNPYNTLPPLPTENEDLNPFDITQFSKLWDYGKMYTGEPYDILDDKLRILLNICKFLKIKPSQFHAVLPRILKGRAESYYLHFIGPEASFALAYQKLKAHFDTEVNHNTYYTDWTTTTFTKIRQENSEKSLQEVLQILIDRLELCQRALGQNYAGEEVLRTAVIMACRGIPELKNALFKPAKRCEELFSDLRSSIEASLHDLPPRQFITVNRDENDQYYLDRRYNTNRQGRSYGRENMRENNSRLERPRNNGNHTWKKKCFVCGKEGCWSTKHPIEERRRARSQYLAHCQYTGDTSEDFATYLIGYEGHEMDAQQYDDQNDPEEENYAADTANYLMNQAYLHQLTGTDAFKEQQTAPANQFLIEDRYSRTVFQGILPDTGAARVSTAGLEQYLALNREDSSVQLDKSTAGQASVCFGKGSMTTSIGTTKVNTPIGDIIFHVLDTPTPFLLCLADMDRMGVYFNNITDELVNDKIRVPMIRKWGHPWFFLNRIESSTVFLTETELRRLHRRFGHPATDRLFRLLKRAGHEDVDKKILDTISNFCHHCQMHSPAPRRFKFSLRDDLEFNHEIFADVLYLIDRPVLHVVDSATAFQGARFLKSLSSKETWETLRMLWIDTYQGPPDVITHDSGTNFASTEFRNEAKILGITCKQVPTEAHWSVGKVERYHAPFRRAFEILHAELSKITSPEAILQKSIKAVNDTAGPNGLVPTLLVFGAYPRINFDSPPSPVTLKRAEAIQTAMKALRKANAERQVRAALNNRNGPMTHETLALPLNSEVRVWREKDGWQGSYKIIASNGHNVTLDMVNGPATFRSTVIQPYYRESNENKNSEPQSENGEDQIDDDLHTKTTEQTPQPRKRGRPLGSKNKASSGNSVYMTKKEEDDFTLAIKLRRDGIITTPGPPFEEADTNEVNDLIGRGVFKFELFDDKTHGQYRIFKSRMVREIKGKNTKPYEKSRLVVQGYNDQDKNTILTQSPTVQRMSQRLVLALAPSLMMMGMIVAIRDITQAYPQSKTNLSRTVLASLPSELKNKYPEGTIIRVVKPLYGIAEAGVHWFTTYQGHHLNNLKMSTSTYDQCLLISNGENDQFGIVAIQTDDTMMLCTKSFSSKEDEKLTEAQFRAKPKTFLSPESPLEFNGARLYLENNSIYLRQKGQGEKLDLVNVKALDKYQRYIEQRARGAYISSICQPEASFDMSVAAQTKNPEDVDCTALNRRLKWQMGNLLRGIRYVPIDLAIAKILVFTDGSFANNKDFSSQIGFVIVLVNEECNEMSIKLRGNLIHWSSTKCKRITRSVLASEIYGMVNGFDIALAIASTVRVITKRLNLPEIPLILCTDSYSLYQCLVKLGTTKEKRLMVDIMALRQSYERREISEIRWINGDDNPADAMTKVSPNRTLERFLNSNEITIRVEGSVERPF